MWAVCYDCRLRGSLCPGPMRETGLCYLLRTQVQALQLQTADALP
jgi:hypothetical protein